MIYWKEDYRLNVSLIDEQHQRLFQIAEDIYNLLKSDLYTDKYDKILSHLSELKDYTIFHFRSEEDYMKQIGYRKFLSHKVEHDDFISKINNIDLDKIDEDQDACILELLNFVVNWIDEHILQKDRLIVSA